MSSDLEHFVSAPNSFISGIFCHEQGDQRVPNMLPRVIYAERRYGQKPWVSTQETLKSLTNVELLEYVHNQAC